nr:MAG TPA: hypothetical protein [Caudoviricetes sp.]
MPQGGPCSSQGRKEGRAGQEGQALIRGTGRNE